MLRKTFSLDQEKMDFINKEGEQLHLLKSSFLRYLLIDYYNEKNGRFFIFDCSACKEVENEKK